MWHHLNENISIPGTTDKGDQQRGKNGLGPGFASLLYMKNTYKFFPLLSLSIQGLSNSFFPHQKTLWMAGELYGIGDAEQVKPEEEGKRLLFTVLNTGLSGFVNTNLAQMANKARRRALFVKESTTLN